MTFKRALLFSVVDQLKFDVRAKNSTKSGHNFPTSLTSLSEVDKN